MEEGLVAPVSDAVRDLEGERAAESERVERLVDGPRLADAQGAVDISQVIAAIDWVVQHRNAGDLNIRVLNLSLGQAGVTDHRGDLLSAAAERAWNAGIFVWTTAAVLEAAGFVVGSATGLIVAGRLSERFDAFGPALALLAIGPALLVARKLPAAGRGIRRVGSSVPDGGQGQGGCP